MIPSASAPTEKWEKEKQVINQQRQPLAPVHKKKPGIKTGKAAPAKPYSNHHHQTTAYHKQGKKAITMIDHLFSKQRKKSPRGAKAKQCHGYNHIGIMVPLHIRKQLYDSNLVGNKCNG